DRIRGRVNLKVRIWLVFSLDMREGHKQNYKYEISREFRSKLDPYLYQVRDSGGSICVAEIASNNLETIRNLEGHTRWDHIWLPLSISKCLRIRMTYLDFYSLHALEEKVELVFSQNSEKCSWRKIETRKI
ncbi:hypothetical protein WA026_014945, partial [Henosepilachna vigintioctopunctata]